MANLFSGLLNGIATLSSGDNPTPYTVILIWDEPELPEELY